MASHTTVTSPTRRTARDDGFSLVELLVVVVIIGIIGGIAFPKFLSTTRRGYNAQLMADLRNAALVMEEDYVARGGEFDAGGLAGFQATDGVVIVTTVTPDAQDFCLTATIAGHPPRVYHRAGGGLLDEGAACA